MATERPRPVLTIRAFDVGNRRYRLREPLVIVATPNGPGQFGVEFRCEELGICVWGETAWLARGRFRDSIAAKWDTYTMLPDYALSATGVTMKRRLLALVYGPGEGE